jgi:Helix-turn-helix domain
MLKSHGAKHPEKGPNGGSRESGTHKTYREWLGLRELTEYADISERTLRSWIYSPVDPLPAAKVCGKVLVRRSEFDAYLQRHRIKPLEEIDIDAIVRDVVKGPTHGS